MGHGNKSVPLTYYEISAVKHKTVNKKLDYSSTDFTYLKNAYTPDGMELISIDELGRLVNDYKNVQGGKQNARCLLKGLYKDGYNGVNCFQNSPYLFFDIDVKDGKENTHLVHPDTNQTIFNELEKVAVICWRSNSGNGIAGVLYVPQLADYLELDKDLHLIAGKAVTKNLSEYLNKVSGIDPVSFDPAQSKFRQVRFLAEQKQPRSLNPNPFEFSYKVKKKTKELRAGVTAYKPTNYRSPYGTITGQFDSDSDILNVALDCGFNVIGSANGNIIRIKHPLTTSSTSGAIFRDKNIFINHSGSLSPYKGFSPSRLVCTFQYNSDWAKFYEYLRGLGYKEKQTPETEVKDVSRALKCELQNVKDDNEAGRIIFKYCYDLETLPAEQKQKFINENCPHPELKKYFVAYLNLNDYKIKYDKELRIKKYVAEVLPEILNYSDQHGKVILRAETGKGKTTAIFSIPEHRPNANILVLVPLTVIVEQNRKDHEDKAVFIDGTSSKAERERAKTETIVFATYDQGHKILHYTDFDYIVIDEVHQLITASEWRPAVKNLTPYLNRGNVIGLTGTPLMIFKKLGYKLLNVDVPNPQKTKIEVRFLNNKPYNIALSHIIDVKGKALIRLNDTEGLKALKKQFIANKKYKADEVLILHSDKQIKTSKDFKQLAHERIFNDKIKLVLTTSLIDEGVSIDQAGFADIVFIETNYHPRPEEVKQFFARFRNKDPNRKNYLYLRTTEDQTPARFNQNWAYDNTLTALQNEVDQMGEEDVISTHNAIFSNDKFYYEDNTVNLFFLAYSVTESLFKSFNISQFLNYLETNYNLEFNENPDFEINEVDGSIETIHRKEIKQKIAKAWGEHKDEVLQSLYYSTLSVSIRSDLIPKQIFVSDSIKLLVIDNIKAFEKLYSRSKELIRFGAFDPDSILIEYKINEDVTTLVSEKKYKDEVTLLKLNMMIFEPETKADYKAKKRVTKFAKWCEKKEEFTHKEMFRELKKLGVYRNSHFSFKLIVRVLDWFNLEAKKDTKTKLINITRETYR